MSSRILFCAVESRIGRSSAKLAALAVHRVAASRERDVEAAARATPLPNSEPDQLESFEWTLGEMQLGIGQLARRIAFVVRRDLDRHGALLIPAAARAVARSLAAGLAGAEREINRRACGRPSFACAQT